MRIGFVICGDLGLVSGGFHYDRQIIAGLRAAGDEVDVIALPWWGYGRALVSSAAPWALDRRRADVDVVVEDELCHPAVLGRNRRLRRAGVPVVSLVHNLTSRQPRTRARPLVSLCERAYFRGVDAVIAVCEDTLRDVRGCGGAGLPAVVARPGREDSGPAAAPGARAPGALRLVSVGVVAPHKGLHRLLAALANPVVGDVTLDVAGSLTADPSYVASLRRELGARGLGAVVRLHGELDRRDVAALLRRADIFVLPSDREAYPLAALEALGAGLPVLLTENGGTAELLAGSAAGQLLPPDDPAAWARVIAELGHDPARLAAMGQAARARHAAHGPWAETARVISTFLKSLLP